MCRHMPEGGNSFGQVESDGPEQGRTHRNWQNGVVHVERASPAAGWTELLGTNHLIFMGRVGGNGANDNFLLFNDRRKFLFFNFHSKFVFSIFIPNN